MSFPYTSDGSDESTVSEFLEGHDFYQIGENDVENGTLEIGEIDGSDAYEVFFYGKGAPGGSPVDGVPTEDLGEIEVEPGVDSAQPNVVYPEEPDKIDRIPEGDDFMLLDEINNSVKNYRMILSDAEAAEAVLDQYNPESLDPEDAEINF